MSRWLLDTNIISELRRRDRTNTGVSSWFNPLDENSLFLSVVTIGEIRKGIERLRPRDPHQALVFDQWLNELKSSYADRILPIDTPIVETWGNLQAIRPVPTIDAFLAATAICHDLTLVTRNTPDFAELGIHLLNPFSK